MLKDVAREASELEITNCDFKPSSPPVDLAKIDTLHELLALALDDFEKVLRDKRYTVNMLAWHTPEDGKCFVCLAGSVMAGRLGASLDDALKPSAYPTAIAWRLSAVNYLRQGAVSEAATAMASAGVAQYAPGPTYIKAHDFERRWIDQIPFSVCDAQNRRDARRLLSKLRIMQRELAEAGL